VLAPVHPLVAGLAQPAHQPQCVPARLERVLAAAHPVQAVVGGLAGGVAVIEHRARVGGKLGLAVEAAAGRRRSGLSGVRDGEQQHGNEQGPVHGTS
jgi:hypothetical protein